jgi:hypothetical protein
VADSIYLLYHGSICLKKNLITNPDTNKPEIERTKLVNVLFLREGAILGLESVTKAKKYQSSVFCECEYNIFFKIQVGKLLEISDSILDFLLEQYKLFDIKVNTYVNNYIGYKNNYKVLYHEHYIDKGIRKEKYKEGDERRINRQVKDTMEDIKKNQIHKYINDFNEYNVVKKSISSCCLKSPIIDNRMTLRNNLYAEKLRLKLFELTTIDEQQPKTNRSSLKFLTTKNRNKKIDIGNSESEKNSLSAFKRTNLPTDPDTSRLVTNYDYTTSHDILPMTSRSNFHVKHTLFKTIKTEEDDSNYQTINEMHTNLRRFSKPKKVKIKLILNETLVRNLKNWKKIQDKADKFNSGSFNMPLISNIK